MACGPGTLAHGKAAARRWGVLFPDRQAQGLSRLRNVPPGARCKVPVRRQPAQARGDRSRDTSLRQENRGKLTFVKATDLASRDGGTSINRAGKKTAQCAQS